MRAPYLPAIVLAVSYARLDVSRKSNCSWGTNDKNVASWRLDMLSSRPRTWSVGDNDCDRKKQRIEPPDKEQTRKKKLDENNNQTEVRVEGVQQFDL